VKENVCKQGAAAVAAALVLSCTVSVSAFSPFTVNAPAPLSPMLMLTDTASFRIKAGAGLEIREWARNLDKPGTLLFEDWLPSAYCTYYGPGGLGFNLAASGAYIKHRYLKTHDSQGTPFIIEIDESRNWKKLDLNAFFKIKRRYYLQGGLQVLENSLAYHIGYNITGAAALNRFRPCLAFSQTFLPIDLEYKIHTQVSRNPFVYKTILNRKTLSLGFETDYLENQPPVLLSLLYEKGIPEYVFHEQDSLVTDYSVAAAFFKFPFTLKEWHSTVNYCFAHINSMNSSFYLNPSGAGYSQVFMDHPVKGSGHFGLYSIKRKITEGLKVGMNAGYGRVFIDTVQDRKLNLAKYEVLSISTYRVDLDGGISGFTAGAGVDWDISKDHGLSQKLNFIRLYPFYTVHSEEVSAFSSLSYDTLENDVVYSDFLLLGTRWNMKRGRLSLGIEFDQGVPLWQRKKSEDGEPSAPSKKARQDRTIGLERLMLRLGYTIR
jgi:hypothetical protein